MNDQTQAPIEPQKIVYGIKGCPKPPGSGRKKGTPNRRKAQPIEEILEKVAEDLGKEVGSLEVMAIWRLYMVLHRQDEKLGLPEGTITFEMSLQAAFKLMQYEMPKKRSIEVTGIGLSGESFVISTGIPKPVETNEEWAQRAREETEQVEKEMKEKRLAELEAERAAAQSH